LSLAFASESAAKRLSELRVLGSAHRLGILSMNINKTHLFQLSSDDQELAF
jgi:hypothetical protein